MIWQVWNHETVDFLVLSFLIYYNYVGWKRNWKICYKFHLEFLNACLIIHNSSHTQYVIYDTK